MNKPLFLSALCCELNAHAQIQWWQPREQPCTAVPGVAATSCAASARAWGSMSGEWSLPAAWHCQGMDMEVQEQVQWRPLKWWSARHDRYQERLRELGCCSLEKLREGSGEALLLATAVWPEDAEKTKPDSSWRQYNKRQRAQGGRWEVTINCMENILLMRVVKHKLPCVISILGGVEIQLDTSLSNLTSLGLLWAGAGLEGSEGLFQPQFFSDSLLEALTWGQKKIE